MPGTLYRCDDGNYHEDDDDYHDGDDDVDRDCMKTLSDFQKVEKDTLASLLH